MMIKKLHKKKKYDSIVKVKVKADFIFFIFKD